MPSGEARELLHELKVHQVELEMQNDELRKTQLELEASREKYFDLYDMAPVGYFTVGGDWLILEANLAAAGMLGVERNRLARRPLCEWIAPEDQDIHYLHRKRLSETGERQASELRMRRRDGSPFWARMESVHAGDDEAGEPVYRVILSDITGSKLAEMERDKMRSRLLQAKKMESLGSLAGGIAHDFNNLLTLVLGHAEMAIMNVSPTSPARGSLAAIMTAANRAADLCRQILEYTGKAMIVKERVSPGELVVEMARLLETAIPKKTALNLEIEEGLPRILADPGQIRQVVTNLIVNASEAIGDRGGVITVTVGAARCGAERPGDAELPDDLPPGLYVRLEVTDTGCGMDDATRSRIFEPFFSTKFTGRGLGLAAAQGIVRAHGGAIAVRSEPGNGTTFKVLFPAMENVGNGGSAAR